MCRLVVILMVGLGMLVAPSKILAFDPPLDQQGPLTVRIDGPERITEKESPFSVSVDLKNAAKQPVRGTLRLSGIDQWKCIPSDAVSFAVEAESESTIEFQVTPHEPTYAALYPLHARAEFEWENARYTAHPILMIDAAVEPNLSAAPALPWEPFSVARDRSLALWQMPVHRSVIQVFGHEPVTTANGWTGNVASNRASVYVRDDFEIERSSRDAIGIHPPWADGQVGTAWIEYPLTLPADTRITLQFATAMSPNGKGDGVTFRVLRRRHCRARWSGRRNIVSAAQCGTGLGERGRRFVEMGWSNDSAAIGIPSRSPAEHVL